MLLFVTNSVVSKSFRNQSWTENVHPGKKNTLFLRRQRIFICSDLEKYKYTPGDHKSAENIGSPGHYFLLPFIEMCVLTNDFPLVQVHEGLPEGKGLFSKTDIPRYTFLCNYGGTLLSKQEGADYMDLGGDFCYLYEFSFEKNGRSSTFFYNHTWPNHIVG